MPSDPKKQDMAEEIARLYSQARGPGSRYLGYSASRREVQKRFRDRIERAHAERAGAGTSAHPATAAVSDPARHASHGIAAVPDPDVIAASDLQDVSDFKQPISSGPMSVPREHKRKASPKREDLAAPPKSSPASPLPDDRQDSESSPAAPSFPAIALPPGFGMRPPTVVVYSLAARVGKTCLVASLGLALSASGEQVLLADTAADGLLPLYFGSHEARPGLARTFATSSFWASGLTPVRDRAPVKVLNLKAECFPQFDSGQDLLLGKLIQESRGYSRLLIDVATAGDEFSRLLWLQPLVLVPILPEAQSIAALSPLEPLLRQAGPDGEQPEVFYLLNQFDPSLDLHRDVREMLQHRLGERLLPFAIRKSAAFAEALDEGMTVMDYAAGSTAAEDYRELAEWLQGRQAPAESEPTQVRRRAGNRS